MIAVACCSGAAAHADTGSDGQNRIAALRDSGTLWYHQGRYEEAIRVWRQALNFARQAENPASLYLWQWQLGRLYRSLGETDAAIEAWRQAVATLNPIRNQLMNDRRRAVTDFRERIQPVYFGLADLLLAKASAQAEASRQTEQALLHEARDTVEILKTAELQDFFQDECTVALQEKQTPLDAIDPHSAIVYPIILPQRLSLLLSIEGELHQVVVPLDAAELERIVLGFRRYLQFRGSNAYLREAKQLYDWLIRPLHPFLKDTAVNTLVFVPDSILRTIPLAPLHDGQQFLIERYAVAITPGLQLTDPRPFQLEDGVRENIDVLIAGLSEGVQGFSGLPNVPRELTEVQSLVGGEVLQDQQYLNDRVWDALQKTEYGILHMATHGVFGGTDEYSFLLTYDDKLNMSELAKLLRVGIFREQPLALLTLSACQTAVGDERAAFGLAGVAVQSGARSATASLWFVDDEATASLMTRFYRQLVEKNLSKARALQNAQISLLKEERYQHPIYWAPYLMIGNWL